MKQHILILVFVVFTQFPLTTAIAATGGPVEYHVINHINSAAYQAANCTGNGPTQMCDLYPAIKSILGSCAANPPRNHDQVGCVIRLPQGDYTMSDTPVLCRTHEIVGHGGDLDGMRTVLQTAPNKSCFRIAAHGECSSLDTAAPGVPNGAGSMLTGFMCKGSVTGANKNVPGIRIDSTATLRNLVIRQYVQGIQVSAGVKRTPPTNANGFKIHDVRVWNNEHSGLMIDGSDANAFLVEGIDATDNCKNAGKWHSLLGGCSAIKDQSFLGGTFIAPHVALTRGLAAAYDIAGDNNQFTTLINPYTETDAGPGKLSGNSQVLGQIGRSFDLRGGLVLWGRRANAFEFGNSGDPNNRVTLRVGRLASPGVAWEATPLDIGHGSALRLYSRPETSGNAPAWGFNVGNISTDSLQFQMQTVTGKGVQIGTQYLPQLTNLRTGPAGSVNWCPWNPNNTCP